MEKAAVKGDLPLHFFLFFIIFLVSRTLQATLHNYTRQRRKSYSSRMLTQKPKSGVFNAPPNENEAQQSHFISNKRAGQRAEWLSQNCAMVCWQMEAESMPLCSTLMLLLCQNKWANWNVMESSLQWPLPLIILFPHNHPFNLEPRNGSNEKGKNCPAVLGHHVDRK